MKFSIADGVHHLATEAFGDNGGYECLCGRQMAAQPDHHPPPGVIRPFRSALAPLRSAAPVSGGDDLFQRIRP